MCTRNKYSYEFKLRCVKAVLKGSSSIKVAKEQGCDEPKLRLWVWFYRKYGKAGLQPRGGRREYNAAFKLQVLQTIQKEGISLRAACVRFNITSDSVIINWQKAYELQGQAGLISKRKGPPPKMKQPIKRKPRKPKKPLTREEELLRENEYLRAENELLKKLQALVQPNKKQKP